MFLAAGAYEAVVTRSISEALQSGELVPSFDKLDPAEAPAKYAELVAELIERTIASLPRSERVDGGAALVNRVVQLLADQLADVATESVITDPAPHALSSLASPTPDGSATPWPHPLSPLSETLLLTDARKDVNLQKELGSEIASADDIDILGAFIRFSGVRHFLPGIRDVIARGGRVRVMTTTYTGTTEGRALDELRDAGAEVRVSYDRGSTRLHAKAWLFRRKSGFTTAYIGSSNLDRKSVV